jgi:hypothetical protein
MPRNCLPTSNRPDDTRKGREPVSGLAPVRWTLKPAGARRAQCHRDTRRTLPCDSRITRKYMIGSTPGRGERLLWLVSSPRPSGRLKVVGAEPARHEATSRAFADRVLDCPAGQVSRPAPQSAAGSTNVVSLDEERARARNASGPARFAAACAQASQADSRRRAAPGRLGPGFLSMDPGLPSSRHRRGQR